MERKFLVKDNYDLDYYGKGTKDYVYSCEEIILLLGERDYDFRQYGRTVNEGKQVVLDKLKVRRGTFSYGGLTIELLNDVSFSDIFCILKNLNDDDFFKLYNDSFKNHYLTMDKEDILLVENYNIDEGDFWSEYIELVEERYMAFFQDMERSEVYNWWSCDKEVVDYMIYGEGELTDELLNDNDIMNYYFEPYSGYAITNIIGWCLNSVRGYGVEDMRELRLEALLA